MMSRAIIGNMLLLVLSAAGTAAAADVPSVSADLGTCSAHFTVTDGSKPIYNAKVRTRIKYGTFGIRKIDLEVGTDSTGQAIVDKLPEMSKQPIAFDVEKDGVSRTVLFEPEKQCKAEFKVDLRRPIQPTYSQP